ncbi:hypothetical protein IAD21_06437 (plasmid) [Abditibacteriota bacterium]|nr:hypothetical protein IAD21_06437 [Abditibacteriota bacterium]
MNNNDDESPPPSEKALSAPDFLIHTSPEMDALERAAADGKHGRHYTNLPMEPARVHQVQGASHYVRLDLTDAEQMAGAQTEFLENLTDAQDADSALAFLYISRLLAPPSPLAVREYAGGKIDLDDVIAKIGWDPRTSTERREMHKRLYQFMRFAERATVIGVRRGKYKDKHTGQTIPTEIRASLWRIIKVEMPEQQSLYPEMDVPVSVELVMSREWTSLLTQPQTAQYLPMGELLGSIPGNKPSGAWARVIGLALASFWRRLPRESMDGSVKPTRRELLERYPPKTGSVSDVLATHNPQYIITYWCGALQILSDAGFIARDGDPQKSAKEMRAELPRQGWADVWLDTQIDIQPGPLMADAIKSRGSALPVPVPTARKRGRPRRMAN